MSDQVRFVRIRGRIVPIRQSPAHHKVDQRRVASALVAGAGTAASVPFLGAAAHRGFSMVRGSYLKKKGIKALKRGRLFSAAGSLKSIIKNKAHAHIGSKFLRPVFAIPLGIAAAGYLALGLSKPRSKK